MFKKLQIKSLLSHIALFIVIEIIFVLIVFRELPAVNLYTTIGILHILYWLVVLGCSLWREKAKKMTMRFLALWTPMVLHLLIHIYIGFETVHEHNHGHEHHEGELMWLILGTIIAGVLIYFGEKLLHKQQHCATHHQHAHKDCIEKSHGDCEGSCEEHRI